MVNRIKETYQVIVFSLRYGDRGGKARSGIEVLARSVLVFELALHGEEFDVVVRK